MEHLFELSAREAAEQHLERLLSEHGCSAGRGIALAHLAGLREMGASEYAAALGLALGSPDAGTIEGRFEVVEERYGITPAGREALARQAGREGRP